jgi:hypothetical protein
MELIVLQEKDSYLRDKVPGHAFPAEVEKRTSNFPAIVLASFHASRADVPRSPCRPRRAEREYRHACLHDHFVRNRFSDAAIHAVARNSGAVGADPLVLGVSWTRMLHFAAPEHTGTRS